MIKSTYIHIPFCKKKCNYCSFTSFERIELKTIYMDALLKEIKMFYDKTPQETLYIGGGTPSILGIGDFEDILSDFNFEENPEITVEVNPESAKKEYLKELRKLGVNRLSIGVQSFCDDILKQAGRIHSSDEAFEVIKNAKIAGFENVSIDLMYGLPNQGIRDFKKDIQTAKKLDIEHLSLYGLKIDKGCYFYKNKPKNIANDDIQAYMYLNALETLEPEFKRYEISNFSKNGEYKSKHNINYWKCGKYYGFGTSASGFLNEGRYTNTTKIHAKIRNLKKQTLLRNLYFWD